MRLKPAHSGAFKEDIGPRCSNRLYRQALECLDVAPLPTMGVWVTRQVCRKRTFWDNAWVDENARTLWQVLTGVKKEPRKYYLSLPERWRRPFCFTDYRGRYIHDFVGRKDRRLVVRLMLEWRVTDSQPNEKCSVSYDDPERNSGSDDHVYHYFTTDVEIFPLTLQQAAFVGARVDSTSTGLYWGTAQDVAELQIRFPISRVGG